MKARSETGPPGNTMASPHGVSEREWLLILDLYRQGPDCAKFISRRLGLDMGEVMVCLRRLEAHGWIERVKGTFLMKKGMKRPKHMNHTYYELSRGTELYLRQWSKKRRSV